MTIPITIAANFAGSQGYATTAPAASASFTLLKIPSGGSAVAIGTITFAASAKTATFSGGSASLVAGDVLQMQAVSPQDSALSDVGVTILAMRV